MSGKHESAHRELARRLDIRSPGGGPCRSAVLDDSTDLHFLHLPVERDHNAVGRAYRRALTRYAFVVAHREVL